MINKKMIYFSAVLIALLLIAGCVPEDSIEWSDDGSVGLMRVKGALYLVDGQTGQLTSVEEKDVQPWPGLTRDGGRIAYAQGVECASLPEGLKQLPAGQVTMIEYAAEQMKNDIAAGGGLKKGEFPLCRLPVLEPEPYKKWVIRYLCEKYSGDISKMLSAEEFRKAGEIKVGYYRIVVADRNALDKKRVIATSALEIRGAKFSPDCKYVAYLMHTQEGQVKETFDEQSLYLTAVDGDYPAVFVDHPVAVGFQWRGDGKALVYPVAESKSLGHSDLIAGVIREKFVTDEQNHLSAEPVAALEQGSPSTHLAKGEARQIAGILFQPWMKACYGPEGHIFFSTVKMQVPASNLNEGQWSLFCCDPLTQGIIEILPADFTEKPGLEINSFSLSPDGRKVILPMVKNRFACFELGKTAVETPIKEEEGFGDEKSLKFAPAWKGGRICCLVGQTSHFLKDSQRQRPEMIVIDAKGDLENILSKSWPDSILESLTK
jgi:hypothetical protein